MPDGFRVGHWTDLEAVTGCTVILCPPATVGSCDIRGSSPGTREVALLASDKTMQEVHAVVLTGGSAFGLAAADGVVRYLEEQGIGYQTPWAKVPIVPAAVIFDLNIGSSSVRPTAESGYQACRKATSELSAQGTIGVGTGATVGKWAGTETRMKGGLGCAHANYGEFLVSAIVAVNAVGDVLDEKGSVLAGAISKSGKWLAGHDSIRVVNRSKVLPHMNTTLAVLLTNARLTKVEANRMAQRGHDGLARAIDPVHTSFDGDLVFALSAGTSNGNFDLVAEMGTQAIAEAVRSAVRSASSLGGVPAAGDLRPS